MSSMLADAIARRGMHSDTVRAAELEKRLAAAKKATEELRATNKALVASNRALNADLANAHASNSTLNVELADAHERLSDLSQEVEGANDNIAGLDKYKRQADSLIRCVSGYPEQGHHWGGLRQAMNGPSQVQCEPCQAPVWMEDWNANIPPLPHAAQSFTQELCDAIVCLYQASSSATVLDVEAIRLKTRDRLRHLVNGLATATEVHLGLCTAFSIATKMFLAQAEASPFDITLLLCQIANLTATKCPSNLRHQTAADIRISAARHLNCSNERLLDAVLGGWQEDGTTATTIEFCCPTVNGDGHAVYVHSVDAVLFIGNGLKLCWLSRSCIIFENSTLKEIQMGRPDTHEVINFAVDKVRRGELWRLLARWQAIIKS